MLLSSPHRGGGVQSVTPPYTNQNPVCKYVSRWRNNEFSIVHNKPITLYFSRNHIHSMSPKCIFPDSVKTAISNFAIVFLEDSQNKVY